MVEMPTRCSFCGREITLRPPHNCSVCGSLFCEDHDLPEDHKCLHYKSRGPLAPDGCPKCGSTDLSEDFTGAYEETMLDEKSLDWQTKFLWWFRSFDPIPYETIVKKGGSFFLRRASREKRVFCRRCGSGIRPYDFARKDVFYCRPDELVADASDRLVEKNIGSLVVHEKGGKNIGLLTDALILKAVTSGRELCEIRVKELELEPLVSAPRDADMKEVLKKFKESVSGRIALVDGAGRIVGILKEKNLRRFAGLLR